MANPTSGQKRSRVSKVLNKFGQAHLLLNKKNLQGQDSANNNNNEYGASGSKNESLANDAITPVVDTFAANMMKQFKERNMQKLTDEERVQQILRKDDTKVDQVPEN